jgi:colicin import membrane protein
MATTFDDVATAAQQLLGAKQAISVRSVRRVLGKGSPNVIHRHLRDWRTTQLVPGTSQTPVQMVAQLTEAAPRFWALALEEARAQVRAEMTQLQQALDQAKTHVDEVQGLLDDGEAQRLQAVAEQQRAVAALETLSARFAALQDHSAQSARQLDEAQAGLRTQQAMTMHLTKKVDELEEKEEQARLRHQQQIATRDDALQALGRESDTIQAHLDTTIAERDRLAADLTAVRKLVEERGVLMRELERQATADRATWNIQEQGLHAEVLTLRAAATSAETALAPLVKAVETNAEQLVIIAEVRERLGTLLPALMGSIAEHIGILDRTIREAMSRIPPGNDGTDPPHIKP